MIIRLKNPITRDKLSKAQQAVRKGRKPKGFNPDPFIGKIKWAQDAVKIQRQMRNEWI